VGFGTAGGNDTVDRRQKIDDHAETDPMDVGAAGSAHQDSFDRHSKG
jgi:hypothetical protein